ncbi:hypothetical protein TEA_005960 [Camellia sinensis var. sinensis]|uniref:Protein kinase domain-containing protein n=1 Tax=Camellia sinensis var. sinensis TaxID=542762 RepID=A0A4S4ECE4_CAMSN|nr:hypothetical protein TEA_005960 [Camellia sinensis var. sinensis]
MSRVVMDVSGQLKQLTWPFGTCNQNTQPFCNCLIGFNPKLGNDWYLGDYSGGCVRRTKLQCGNASAANQGKDRFQEYSNMRLPEHPQFVASGSATECESSCLKNCSCTAYAYDRNGCSIWTMDLVNLQQLLGNDSSGSSLYLRLAASEFSRDNNMGIIIGVVGSVVVVLGLLYVMWKQQRRLIATPCVLWPNTCWLSFLGKDRIYVLHGFCFGGNKKLLVYDYMQNGSLDSHLFHGKESKVLDKKTRYQIALGTARGLAFLHEGCRDCIVHYDIKPQNILLDVEFCPKVADFGLAKLIGRELIRVLTTMRGTTGHLAPEWIVRVAITTKAHVYSYGMMLFELISGRRNCDQSEARIVKFFPIRAASVVIEGGDVHCLLDHMLEKRVDVEEAQRICKVAC